MANNSDSSDDEFFTASEPSDDQYQLALEDQPEPLLPPQPHTLELAHGFKPPGRVDYIDHIRSMPPHLRPIIGTPERILTPRSDTIDISMRVDPEYADPFDDPWITVADQFDLNNVPTSVRSTGLDYTSILKQEFQRNPILRFENEMFASTIIGWTQENGQTMFANRSDLGDLTEDVVPMTDTIFPVFVMGAQELPVIPTVFRKDIFEYDPGLYLCLTQYIHGSSPGVFQWSQEVGGRIAVYKHDNLTRYNVQTLAAQLQYYVVFYDFDEETQSYLKQYSNPEKVDRILDIHNTAYYRYGMYAGGPIPSLVDQKYRRHRICWDQPLTEGIGPDFGFGSMKGRFRYDIDYQRFSRRIGYFCSKGGLLFASEIRKYNTVLYFHTLLKDYTYVIVDGYSTYCIYYTIVTGSQTRTYRSPAIGNQLAPQMVIIPEGVNGLDIRENPDNEMLRNSELFCENPGLPPIVLNWQQFQTDFMETAVAPYGDAMAREPVELGGMMGVEGAEAAPQGEEGGVADAPTVGMQERGTAEPEQPEGIVVKQVMRAKDINDYCYEGLEYTQRKYLFSLSQRPLFFPKEQQYIEYWNVFCRLRRAIQTTQQNDLYYYLGTISNSHTLSPLPGFKKRHQYSRTYFHPRLFPVEIDRKLYPHITEEEHQRSKTMAEEFDGIMSKNVEFKAKVKKLYLHKPDELFNRGILSDSRKRMWTKLEWVIPRENQ